MVKVETVIAGDCAAKFAAVGKAFADNFSERDELGGAVCVMHRGQLVVDLHGGWADPERSRAWQTDTVVNVWSSTKGIQATCYAIAADRELFNYDQPVSDFWPEFAARNKGTITIGQLLSHQAGLCGFITPATESDLIAGQVAADRLAAQAPLWEPGTASGYHALSIGILGTELFRRIEGRTMRQFVADELAGPLGIALTIGLPADQNNRRAELIPPVEQPVKVEAVPTAPQIAALGNPPLRAAFANSLEWRTADLPSANGHANARALAAVYAQLIASHAPLVSSSALAEATRIRSSRIDLVLGLECAWAAGFLRNSKSVFGPSADAFGHSGWGGSLAFADPANDLAMAYVINRMGSNLRDDPRAVALIDATYAAL